MTTIAVIDVETTGLNPFRHDRIVEVAVVLMDPQAGITGEFTTLVNPARDVGPTRIHGITASDVIHAPRFFEIAGHLVAFLKNSHALAGHNVRFDISFLRAEFARLKVSLPEMTHFDTLSLAGGGSLASCCAKYGVQFDGRLHAALHDARATARLLEKLLSLSPDALAVHGPLQCAPWPEIMTVQRPLLPRQPGQLGRKPAAHLPVNEAAAAQLVETETQFMETEIQPVEFMESWRGKTVCFTGESQCSIQGRTITREMAESLAMENGLFVQGYVTKKLDMLIAADPNTQSTKAQKARQYGTRIIHEAVFWRALRVAIDS